MHVVTLGGGENVNGDVLNLGFYVLYALFC